MFGQLVTCPLVSWQLETMRLESMSFWHVFYTEIHWKIPKFIENEIYEKEIWLINWIFMIFISEIHWKITKFFENTKIFGKIQKIIENVTKFGQLIEF